MDSPCLLFKQRLLTHVDLIIFQLQYACHMFSAAQRNYDVSYRPLFLSWEHNIDSCIAGLLWDPLITEMLFICLTFELPPTCGTVCPDLSKDSPATFQDSVLCLQSSLDSEAFLWILTQCLIPPFYDIWLCFFLVLQTWYTVFLFICFLAFISQLICQFHGCLGLICPLHLPISATQDNMAQKLI